jgi:hypothetical protein
VCDTPASRATSLDVGRSCPAGSLLSVLPMPSVALIPARLINHSSLAATARDAPRDPGLARPATHVIGRNSGRSPSTHWCAPSPRAMPGTVMTGQVKSR